MNKRISVVTVLLLLVMITGCAKENTAPAATSSSPAPAVTSVVEPSTAPSSTAEPITAPETSQQVPNNPAASVPESTSKTSAVAASGNTEITVEDAKKIALDHAGLTAEQVYFQKEKLDYYDGKRKYEIEFYKDNVEYEYDIDNVTGEIISFEKDTRD